MFPGVEAFEELRLVILQNVIEVVLTHRRTLSPLLPLLVLRLRQNLLILCVQELIRIRIIRPLPILASHFLIAFFQQFYHLVFCLFIFLFFGFALVEWLFDDFALESVHFLLDALLFTARVGLGEEFGEFFDGVDLVEGSFAGVEAGGSISVDGSSELDHIRHVLIIGVLRLLFNGLVDSGLLRLFLLLLTLLLDPLVSHPQLLRIIQRKVNDKPTRRQVHIV